MDQAERSLPVRANAAELSVEVGLSRWQSGRGPGYRRVFVRLIEARTRQQLDSAAVQADVHPITVVLDLMQPILTPRRRIDQLAELRLHPLRKTGRMVSRLARH